MKACEELMATTRSVLILQNKLQQLIGTQADLLILGSDDLVWPNSKSVWVALMGGSFRHLLNPFIWPPSLSLRLLVLSHVNKKIMTDILRIPERNVAVVPRSCLFKNKKLPPPYDSGPQELFSKRKLNLVVSSRQLPSKKLYLTIAVCNQLQKLSKNDVRLHICGPNLDAEKVLPWIRSFNWKHAPIFYGDLGPTWIQKMPPTTCLINLSMSFEEDFGVSVALAQSQGWPTILSAWGGHLDQQSKNCIFVPSDFIRSADGNKIAQYLLKQKNFAPVEFRSQIFRPPQPLSYTQIESCLKKCDRKVLNVIEDLLVEQSSPPRDNIANNKILEIMSGLSC